MKLVLIVHNDIAAIDRLITAVQGEQLAGFTLLHSTGRGRVPGARHDEFRFSLRQIYESRDVHNLTLFSILPDDRVARLVALIETHLPDLDEPGTGLYVVLDVASARGLI